MTTKSSKLYLSLPFVSGAARPDWSPEEEEKEEEAREERGLCTPRPLRLPSRSGAAGRREGGGGCREPGR